jgi:hypothetical protein
MSQNRGQEKRHYHVSHHSLYIIIILVSTKLYQYINNCKLVPEKKKTRYGTWKVESVREEETVNGSQERGVRVFSFPFLFSQQRRCLSVFPNFGISVGF